MTKTETKTQQVSAAAAKLASVNDDVVLAYGELRMFGESEHANADAAAVVRCASTALPAVLTLLARDTAADRRAAVFALDSIRRALRFVSTSLPGLPEDPGSVRVTRAATNLAQYIHNETRASRVLGAAVVSIASRMKKGSKR